MAKRWKQRPDGSNWGEFGDDDELGRLNYLTPEIIQEGAREIRTGIRFGLSLPLELPGGAVLNERRLPPDYKGTMDHGFVYINFPLAKLGFDNSDVISDDRVCISTQYSTQWDSLAHIGARFDADGDGKDEIVYYNGFRAGVEINGPTEYVIDGDGDRECPGPYGAQALNVGNYATHPIQGRGVLVNLVDMYGRGRKLIGKKELLSAFDKQGIKIRKGDLLMLYTGFADAVVKMNGAPDKEALDKTGCVLDGKDVELLDWIRTSGISALIADNYAVEAHPHPVKTEGGPALGLHELCLFKLGIPLGELWWLADLAEWLSSHKRSYCFLTAPALRLSRAFGSPVSPVATV